MAILHRKLFPFFNSPPNSPAPCTDYCDPSCSNFHDCYLLDSSPPPLPPPPSPDQHVFRIPFAAVIVIVVLASLFLLVSYWAVLTKWYRFGTRSHPNSRHLDLLETDDDLTRELDGRDEHVDHPIWLISTSGLQQSVIDSITVIKYRKGEELFEGSDCSVCLSEFQEGESLRLLPKCNHAFHIDCIDTWLRSHTNCPLCRADIVVNPDGASLGLNNQSFRDSRRTEMEESDSNDVELGSSRTEHAGGLEQTTGETGEGSELQVSRSASMDFIQGWNSRNLGDPNFQRNPKWSSFRIMGSSSSSSSSWRALDSNQVKRSYSWSEKVLGSARFQKLNLDPESSS